MNLALPRMSRAKATAVGLVTVHVSLALSWVLQHDLPTGARDEFVILEVATDIAYRLGAHSSGSASPFLFENAYYPPLVRLPAIAALMLGGGYTTAVVSGWIWLPLLVVCTWVLARDFTSSEWAATASIAILLASPGLTHSLHHYESNLGPMAITAACCLLWSRTNGLESSQAALGFGLLLGLGMLSDRLGVLPFVIVPISALLLGLRSKKSLKRVGTVVLGAGLASGWWYLNYFQRFWDELVPQFLEGEINPEGLITETSGSITGWLGYYLWAWPDSQLGLLGGGLALCGLVLCLGHSRVESQKVVLLWTVGGLLCCTLIAKRQVFYTLPQLPFAAVLAASALQRLSGALRRGRGLLFVTTLLAVQLPVPLALNDDAIDLPNGLRSWLFLNRSPISEEFLGHRHRLAHPPERVGLDLPAALGAVGLNTGERGVSVAVFSAHDAQVTESYQVTLGRMATKSVDVFGLTLHPDHFLNVTTPPDVLLYVHRDGLAWPSRAALIEAHERRHAWNPEFEALAERLEQWAVGAQNVGNQELRGGERLSIWRLAP